MGRSPKPTAIKIIQGNPGRRPLNQDPQFTPAKMRAPRGLTKRAQKEWRRVVHELHRMGLLGVVDIAALAVYCSAVSDYAEAKEHLATDGKILTTDKGYRYQNPWLAERNKAAEIILKFGSIFGMNPASRNKVSKDVAGKQLSLAEILFRRVHENDDPDK